MRERRYSDFIPKWMIGKTPEELAAYDGFDLIGMAPPDDPIEPVEFSDGIDVSTLIAILERFPAGYRVGFKAACCPYSHDATEIRYAEKCEAEDRHDIVIEALS